MALVDPLSLLFPAVNARRVDGEHVLTDPGVIANRVALPRANDPTRDNFTALGARIGNIDRQLGNPPRRIAVIDDDEFTAPFLVELKPRGEQLVRLRQEREEVLTESTGRKLARTHRDDLT